MENSSTVKYFSLSGLSDTRRNKYLYFSLTLLVYLLIILVNLILIVTVILEKGLHEPIYIFVCNLCVNGLFGTAGFYPKFLLDLLSDVHVISYSGCLAQTYFIYTSVLCEITILTVMAYDRYIAICRPLHYHTIMTPRKTGKLLLLAWFFPLSVAVVSIMFTFMLPLCGSHIQKLYCDNWSIVKLSCVPTTLNNVTGFVIILSQVAQAVFTLCSYCQIMHVCLKSKEGRAKFMQTCFPHLLTIMIFLITTLFDVLYSRYGSFHSLPLSLQNIMAVEFLIIPPLFNPIIYGLNLREIKSRVYHTCGRNCKVMQKLELSQGKKKAEEQNKNTKTACL